MKRPKTDKQAARTGFSIDDGGSVVPDHAKRLIENVGGPITHTCVDFDTGVQRESGDKTYNTRDVNKWDAYVGYMLDANKPKSGLRLTANKRQAHTAKCQPEACREKRVQECSMPDPTCCNRVPDAATAR